MAENKPKGKPNMSHALAKINPKTPSPEKERFKKFQVNNINTIKQRNDEELVFSFLYFDRTHKAFNLGNTCTGWYVELLEVLKELSKMTWVQLNSPGQRGTYDPHPYDPHKANYKFQLDQDILDQFDAFQFRINKSKGRVHGFLLGNRFYIYWLDPHHNMSDSPGYQTAQTYKAPPILSCFEQLNQTNTNLLINKGNLEKEISELKKQIESLKSEKVELENKNLKILELLEKKGIADLESYI